MSEESKIANEISAEQLIPEKEPDDGYDWENRIRIYDSPEC